MPTIPKYNKCRELGCNNPKTYRSTFCSKHGGGLTQRNKENNKLYNSNFWKKLRIAQLSKEPLCASCLTQGRVVQAEHIDHVFPHRQDEKKFRYNIFQSLCAICHTYKTQEEDKGIYTHYTHDGIKTYTDADYVGMDNRSVD